MSKIFVYLLFIVLNLFTMPIPGQAEEELKKKETPAGMEIIGIGTEGQQLILPKGTKTRKVGAQLIIEDNAEYMVQRILALEKRVEKLETANERLERELQELKN